MKEQSKPGDDQQPGPGTVPDEAIKVERGAVPDTDDIEGHGVQAPLEGSEPDETLRFGKAVPDTDDIEGHGVQRPLEGSEPDETLRYGKAVPDTDDIEGHGVQRPLEGSEPDKPGPDEAIRNP